MAARPDGMRKHLLLLIDSPSSSDPLRAAVSAALRHYCAVADSADAHPQQLPLELSVSLLVAKEAWAGWLRPREVSELLDSAQDEHFADPWDGGDVLQALDRISSHQTLDIVWAFDGSVGLEEPRELSLQGALLLARERFGAAIRLVTVAANDAPSAVEKLAVSWCASLGACAEHIPRAIPTSTSSPLPARLDLPPGASPHGAEQSGAAALAEQLFAPDVFVRARLQVPVRSGEVDVPVALHTLSRPSRSAAVPAVPGERAVGGPGAGGGAGEGGGDELFRQGVPAYSWQLEARVHFTGG
ncbi:hypothetical protein T484DRAFT_1875316 [Baffinella frigidus]|nr:hypothetical protein T484DRAFT_1875316 [Cryptophyta sp. CCMP2293]